MRRFTLWAALLLQLAAVLYANEQGPLPGDGQREPPPYLKAGKDVEAGAGAVGEPGAGFVDEALQKLGNIPQIPHHKRRKQAGVVSTVFRYALKALPRFPISAPLSAPPPGKVASIGGPLADAVGLLDQAAWLNNSDALYLLAEMNYHGNYTHPRNLKHSFDLYRRLASMHGNATAQYMVGVFYGTGIGGVVPRDPAKALVYYTFAAAGGDTRAEMAVAFRHHSGIGTPKNCEEACKYYKQVADKAMKWYRSGPPGGMVWVQEAWRVADEYGGVYGEGASASSAGLNAIKASVNSDAHAAIDDVIEYLDLLSQKGDSKASYNLGRIYYEGQRGLERDLGQALNYFIMVAKRYWKKDGRILENYKPGIEKIASKAAGYIGRMFLRGDGVEQSFERAKMWFERGMAYADAQSQHGMATILLNGYGVPRDIERATRLLKGAADQDYAPAQVDLGVLHLDQGDQNDLRIANDYFELAARWGNIEAYYYLAELIYNGVGRDRTCSMALSYYKNVAEKAEPLVSSWAEANLMYDEGDHEGALLEYLLAAEQGYEKGQNNVAFLLDPAQSTLPVWRWLHGKRQPSPVLENPSLALIEWNRSSRQNNVDSMVKMGDYYYYGIGTEVDIPKAVQCYSGASDYAQSAQALYNLGWMHENGMGLTQDFHLAKRFYDQALEVNEEAYLPVTLSLVKLRMRSAWNTFTRGPIHSIQDEPEPSKEWSLREWITNFMQEEDAFYDEEQLYEDIFDDTIGDGEEGLDGGSFQESFAIISVAMVLILILYYRQMRQQAQRAEPRREQAAQAGGNGNAAQQPGQDGNANGDQEERDRGVFPPQGNPEVPNWAVGGVGH